MITKAATQQASGASPKLSLETWQYDLVIKSNRLRSLVREGGREGRRERGTEREKQEGGKEGEARERSSQGGGV